MPEPCFLLISTQQRAGTKQEPKTNPTINQITRSYAVGPNSILGNLIIYMITYLYTVEHKDILQNITICLINWRTEHYT